jgi:hypothetical protein
MQFPIDGDSFLRYSSLWNCTNVVICHIAFHVFSNDAPNSKHDHAIRYSLLSPICQVRTFLILESLPNQYSIFWSVQFPRIFKLATIDGIQGTTPVCVHVLCPHFRFWFKFWFVVRIMASFMTGKSPDPDYSRTVHPRSFRELSLFTLLLASEDDSLLPVTIAFLILDIDVVSTVLLICLSELQTLSSRFEYHRLSLWTGSVDMFQIFCNSELDSWTRRITLLLFRVSQLSQYRFQAIHMIIALLTEEVKNQRPQRRWGI